jgi:hypothetical protein
MERIIEEAARLYQQYGGEDLDYLAQRLGVRVREVAWLEEQKEAYFHEFKTVMLRPGLPRHERNFLLAHGLGHHLFDNPAAGGDLVGLHQEHRCGLLAAAPQRASGQRLCCLPPGSRGEVEANVAAKLGTGDGGPGAEAGPGVQGAGGADARAADSGGDLAVVFHRLSAIGYLTTTWGWL